MDASFNSNDIFDYKVLHSQLSELKSHITIIQNNLKLFHNNSQKQIKQLKKENKELNKKLNKQKKNKGKSGFAAPINISHKLADFIGVPFGTKISRTFVTQYIHNYIKLNKLQDPKNKKLILPDEKLSHLFSLKDFDKQPEIHFFNIQKFLNPHFV